MRINKVAITYSTLTDVLMHVPANPDPSDAVAYEERSATARTLAMLMSGGYCNEAYYSAFKFIIANLKSGDDAGTVALALLDKYGRDIDIDNP